MNVRSDVELAQAAATGDKSAFVDLVARYQQLVTAITLAILKDFQASEDAAQEAFVAAWQKIGLLKDGTRLRPWLGGIARNTALMHLRKQRVEDSLDGVTLRDKGLRPDEHASRLEDQVSVLKALDELPEKIRVPLILFYREEQSIRSVSQALGLNENTVKKRLARGRKLLRSSAKDLVDSVLLRTAPGSIFTLTVAGTIGAMLQPTAVAATAFSSKPLASTTLATATTMTSTKVPPAMVALIATLCIPVGYTAHSLIPERGQSSPLPSSQSTDTLRSESQGISTVSQSALAREWQALLESYDGNSSRFPDLYQHISTFPSGLKREAFHTLLITEWTKLAPAEGFAFLLGKEGRQRDLLVNEWFPQDTNAAIAALRNLDEGKKGVIFCYLELIAEYSPSSLLEVVQELNPEELNPGGYHMRYVERAYKKYHELDPKAALASALQLSGTSQAGAWSGIVDSWAEADQDAALIWIRKIQSSALRNELLTSFVRKIASKDPREALSLFEVAPPSGSSGEDRLGREILARYASRDFEGALKWLSENPTKKLERGLNDQIGARLRDNPVDLIEQLLNAGVLERTASTLSKQRDIRRSTKLQAKIWQRLLNENGDGATKLRSEIVRRSHQQDALHTLGLIKQLPDTPKTTLLAQELANKIWRDIAIPDQRRLIEQARPSWQPIFIERAFSRMNPEGLVNATQIANWESYYEQLPPGSVRYWASSKVARGIARQAPERMTGFFNRLDDNEDSKAFAGAAFMNELSKTDPEQASQWLRETPMVFLIRRTIEVNITTEE